MCGLLLFGKTRLDLTEAFEKQEKVLAALINAACTREFILTCAEVHTMRLCQPLLSISKAPSF